MAKYIEKIQSEIEDEQSDVAPYKIVYYPADYTLQGLYDKWRSQEIEIPDFQRGFVWTYLQACRLIESFLLGLPVPGIFFYRQQVTNKLVVIDGQQRLRSVFGYFEGFLPDSKKRFVLEKVRSKWNGRSYKDLDEADQIRLRDSVLRATIVDQLDPKDNSSVFHIYERLNTGGTVLKPQEVRNSLYHGTFNNLLLELNNLSKWRKIFGSPHKEKRMRDVELILRFLALHESWQNYYKPMKKFLNDFMDQYQNADQEKLSHFRAVFESTISRTSGTLGSKPFNIRTGLNAAVFDSVMVALASLKTVTSDVKKRYEQLKSDESFQEYTLNHTTDVDRVKGRIKLAKEILSS